MKRLVLLFLGESGRQRARKWLAYANAKWLLIACKSELISRLHMLLFTRAFGMEAHAVVSGQVKHLANRNNHERMNYYLRRGVHRLEKGLIMPDRRAIFGLDFIEDLVSTYSEAIDVGLDESELQWAHDVLSAYFDAVGEHLVIARARSVFHSAPLPRYVHERPSAPYLQNRKTPSPVNAQALRDLALRRRSVRFFEPSYVPRELLDTALDIANLSPSACNRQPIEFRIFDDPKKASEVAGFAGGTTGFADNIPCTIALIGRLRAYPYDRDRHAIYVDGGLAAMSFMLALETLGLASCPINWPDVRQRDLDIAKSLALDADERVVMLIAVGKPRDGVMVAASSKLSLEIFRKYSDNANHKSAAPGEM